MVSLSIFQHDSKTVLKWALIIVAIIFGIFVLIKGVLFIKNIFIPAKPTPATVTFGKLPAISFQNGLQTKFTYKLDTISGELPTLPDKMNVYKMGGSEPDILAVEKAKEKVNSVGFQGDPEQLSDTTYVWKKEEPFSQELVINTLTGQVNLTSAILNNDQIKSAINLPTEEQAISDAKSFLNNLSLFTDDLDEESVITQLYSIDGNVINPASSLSNTELIGVYFPQKKINDLDVYYPRGLQSPVGVIIGTDDLIVDVRYFHQNVTDESATYPIKTAKEAWEELKKGKGYIASYNGTDNEILVKDIGLGYYMEGKTQKYLQPVVVFKGNDDFLAFVSAVKGEWIGK